VKDKGEGMSGETINRATEPFFTTKGIGKGTGLGLSMVQGFAEQSGGRLNLQSSAGMGTTAEIWLPATEARQGPEVVELPPGIAKVAKRELVVLAVDDDVLVRMGTVAMLEDLGHTVIEAGSGDEALQCLANGLAVDVVVTDQAMPRMTGVELAAAILAEKASMPIIIATGYAELQDGLGAQLPRLSKPFSQKQLAAAISEVLAGGSNIAP
jgi:CheY-like chemotaxis protein